MPSITTQQLNKILEVNTKSVEIYLEVEEKYNDILEELQKINKIINDNNIDNKDHIKDQYLHVDRMKNIFEQLKEALENSHKKLIAENIEIKNNIDKMEKEISKQNFMFGGTILSAIIAIILKFVLGI